jgi:alpha-tubulin suppressor-like RCC1 family protein
VSGGHVWAVVATSQSHSCGITTSGTAYCWGSNFYGQFGEPAVTSPYWRTVPVRVLTELTLRAGSPP